MTNEERKRVEEIRERGAKATGKLWEVISSETEDSDEYQLTEYGAFKPQATMFTITPEDDFNDADLDFIADSRSDIPFLLNLVKRQEEENACLTAALSKAEKQAEAAIETIKRSKPCEHCAHFADDKYCTNCDDQCSNFKWRDPTEQEEST